MYVAKPLPSRRMFGLLKLIPYLLITDYFPRMDATQRFSDRVENYAKFRPAYPEALIRFIQQRLPAPAVIADIGSGTGILSNQLLAAGYTVFGVEPNQPMRREAERRLGSQPSFHSVGGTSEATTLFPGSIEAVTCAQSFHWFDRAPTRIEFGRILREPKLVWLIWNERICEDLMEEYDRILQESAPEYNRVGRRNITDADVADFFAPTPVERLCFPNAQRLDRDGFLGRVLSSSYVPNVGQPRHEKVMNQMEAFFDRHAQSGWIDFPYQTRVFLSYLSTG